MAAIEFQAITKRFPGVVALDQVSFGVSAGSCHALIGENGAGKSTLGKILAGVYMPDSGQILVEGKPIRPATPLAARSLGIAMVHQELAFCPNLSVAENLCLGDLPRQYGFVQRSIMRVRAERMLATIDTQIDVDRPISELTTGQEQVIQIAAAVGTGARVIVMDEPTSSLSARETNHLFALLAQLRDRGITVIYVSHRMPEIFRFCDRITVLRDGQHVWTGSTQETNLDGIIRHMVGRDVSWREPAHTNHPLGETVLRAEQLTSRGRFQSISFELRQGEILGFAGLVGAGRSEVAQAVAGLDSQCTGRIEVLGKGIPLGKPTFAHGIGFLPEDRKRQGLVLSMNCRENISLASLARISRGGFVSSTAEQSLLDHATGRLCVKAPSFEAPIHGLSGGNQQKIALAKWLAHDCKILIVDEPTRGIDVGAKAEIHALLDELACQGLAILLISSELPEVMRLSRRILVLSQGRMSGEVQRADFSEAGLLRLMAGI